MSERKQTTASDTAGTSCAMQEASSTQKEALCAPTDSASVQAAPAPEMAQPYILPVAPQPAARIDADQKDRLFASLYLLLGYAFVSVFTDGYPIWLSFSSALALFTVAYAAVVLGYVYIRGLRPPAESWLWLGVMLCLAVPFMWYTVLGFIQVLALMLVAAYWTLCVAGALLEGRTSNFVAADGVSALVLVPFGNFGCLAVALLHGLRKTRAGRGTLYVALGLILAVPLLGVVLPLLGTADPVFQSFLTQLFMLYRVRWPLILLRLMAALPVAFYLFGLGYGALYRRRTQLLRPSALREALHTLRLLPNVAVYTVAGILCAVYLLFILLQAKYLFSGLMGVLPSGYTFAQYARTGFFELCRIGMLNLTVLTGMNMLAKTQRAQSSALRMWNMVLAVLSLLLLVTAGGKMALYISAYGFTLRRVLASVFLLWMAVVFGALLVWQRKRFGIARVCVAAGVVLFCALCVVDVRGCVNGCNAARRAAGTGAPTEQAEMLYDDPQSR